MKINLKSKINRDKYTEYVCEAFDIQDSDTTESEVSFKLGEAKDFRLEHRGHIRLKW